MENNYHTSKNPNRNSIKVNQSSLPTQNSSFPHCSQYFHRFSTEDEISSKNVRERWLSRENSQESEKQLLLERRVYEKVLIYVCI